MAEARVDAARRREPTATAAATAAADDAAAAANAAAGPWHGGGVWRADATRICAAWLGLGLGLG